MTRGRRLCGVLEKLTKVVGETVQTRCWAFVVLGVSCGRSSSSSQRHSPSLVIFNFHDFNFSMSNFLTSNFRRIPPAAGLVVLVHSAIPRVVGHNRTYRMYCISRVQLCATVLFYFEFSKFYSDI